MTINLGRVVAIAGDDPPTLPRTTWTILDALSYARSAHAQVVNPDGSLGQKRKYTGEPYITHPIAVAGIVAAVEGHTREMLAAAFLHDTVEDTRDNPEETRITVGKLAQRFGPTVADYVDWLSDLSTPADGNRAARKTAERERLARAPAAAQTIKLADLIHNTQSIVAHDPSFARLYLEEKLALLEVLTRGDEGLLSMARACAENGLALARRWRAPGPLFRPEAR